MTPSIVLNRVLRDTEEIVQVLRGLVEIERPDLHGANVEAIATAADKSARDLQSGAAIGSVDADLAEVLHRELAPVRTSAPWVLNDPLFWQWLAFLPLRSYTLRRWCDGGDWVDDPDREVPRGVIRFVLTAGSVKTHARHSVRRLYLYAECSHAYDGTYDHLDEILGADQDIVGAVFERKLGLSPLMALVLITTAAKFAATKKSASEASVSARKKYREFFRQVNLLVSTVAVEYLDEGGLSALFDAIARDLA